MTGLKHIFLGMALLLMGVSACDCTKVDPVDAGYDQVTILYSVGRNSLDENLKADIDEFASGNIPSTKDKKALLVITHNYYKASDTWGVFDSSPYIIRLSRDAKGEVVKDTVKTYNAREDGQLNLLTDPAFMTTTISDACSMFPSKSYGMIFSSHGTGWLPRGYYNSPSSFEQKVLASPSRTQGGRSNVPYGALPYVPLEKDPDSPATKSFGEEVFVDNLESMSLEMNVQDLANALPVHLDFIIFDACLMGTVEVAYEFRAKCDRIVFSPAEILSDGFDYANMADRLFGGAEPDVRGIAEDYFNYYNAKKSSEQSATVTLVDCSQLEALASVCRNLYEKYRSGLAEVDVEDIDKYFRYDRHWFYDLESVLVAAGMTAGEKRELELSLEKAAPYRAVTRRVLGELVFRTYSGFSTYLPCMGSGYLDDFYRTLSWNKATGLVK